MKDCLILMLCVIAIFLGLVLVDTGVLKMLFDGGNFMHGLKVCIEPQDIINRLSDKDKERFNQCVFTNVVREMDGSVTIDCIVFDDPDPYVQQCHRQKYFSDEPLETNV